MLSLGQVIKQLMVKHDTPLATINDFAKMFSVE